MDNRYKLELVGITYNQIESGVYALILQQEGTSLRIPIIIGFSEAQAIECKLQDVQTPRPLTHDTMMCALKAFGINLVEVFIKKIKDGVFAADIVLSDGVKEMVIDSRSSDAIALAIRADAPIYTSKAVLNESGFEQEESKIRERDFNFTGHYPFPKPIIPKKGNGYRQMTNTQLSKAMEKAVEDENYEEAAKIKNELQNRENQTNPS